MALELQQPLLSLRKYPAILSSEQRQSYKTDFNAEYSEYRGLHARIEQITRRFTQLDAQLRQLSQGSEEYEVLHAAGDSCTVWPRAPVVGPGSGCVTWRSQPQVLWG